MKLWKAAFETTFFSSSGMQKYNILNTDIRYVVTSGDSIGDVVKTIESYLSCQTKVTKTIGAEFLGDAIVEVLEAQRPQPLSFEAWIDSIPGKINGAPLFQIKPILTAQDGEQKIEMEEMEISLPLARAIFDSIIERLQ